MLGAETDRYQQEQQQMEDPDQVVVKQEPEDYYMDSVEEITVGAAYSLTGAAAGEESIEPCPAVDADPLDNQPAKLQRRKKKKRSKRIKEEEKVAVNLTNGIAGGPVASTSSKKLSKSAKEFKISETTAPVIPKMKVKVDKNAIRVSSSSLDLYMKTYNDFMAWKTETAPAEEIDEELLLMYFKRISAMYSTSTLTNKLSHIVNTMATFHKINVDGFVSLRKFVRDLRSAHLMTTSGFGW